MPETAAHTHRRQFEKPRFEVADIFRRYGAAYRAKHKLSVLQHRVMRAIEQCRTKLLGGVTQACTQCGYVDERWFSCRNRHCPKCQGTLRWKWVGARLAELLPIPYYHVPKTCVKLVEFILTVQVSESDLVRIQRSHDTDCS
ncbi:MAG: transposase zinc-binding domain-containing protein [Nitrososphaerales archaeon]